MELSKLGILERQLSPWVLVLMKDVFVLKEL
jgi:hypothetical protein